MKKVLDFRVRDSLELNWRGAGDGQDDLGEGSPDTGDFPCEVFVPSLEGPTTGHRVFRPREKSLPP